MEILGYSSPLSVRPGERVDFMVSTEQAEYRADIVRLIHGDENPIGPGFVEEVLSTEASGTYPGKVQQIPVGSAAIVADHMLLRPSSVGLAAHVLPTTPSKGRQGILTKWSDVDRIGYGLYLDDEGRVEFVVRVADAVATVTTHSPLTSHRWYGVAGGFDVETGRATVVGIARQVGGVEAGRIEVAESEAAGPIVHSSGPFVMAAEWEGSGDGPATLRSHLNGKISAPLVWSAAVTTDDLVRVLDGAAPASSLVASWDLADGMGSSRVVDASPNRLSGRTLNMPTRAVTGHLWRGGSNHPARAPAEYNAIHFHDDDLDDASWDVGVSWDVAPEAPSGIYALRLRTPDGGSRTEDHVPFFVLPALDRPASPVAFLAPTNCYFAYANERLEDSLDPGIEPAYTDDQDRYDYIVTNHLLSIYDLHSDGTGVCYSSRLRPNLTMRPRHRMRLNNIPHLLSGDLHITNWLEHEGYQFDVLTDEALHFGGAELLLRHQVVITGTHPEYWSSEMLDALETFLTEGGRCMYLGGNGFYWVTAFDPERPHIIEVRRPPGTTRAWEAWPGEYHLSSTGELGGLWRHRGRAPQRLLGVGFTAQGFDRSAPYYLSDEIDDQAKFVFEGVDVIGGSIGDQDSLVLDHGAAGFEIDRVDHQLGTPTGTILLASSHHTDYSDSYQHVVEEIMMSDSRQSASVNPMVRADLVLVPYPNGGAVFSTGSIAWSGALAPEGYSSAISRITHNVLDAFLDESWEL